MFHKLVLLVIFGYAAPRDFDIGDFLVWVKNLKSLLKEQMFNQGMQECWVALTMKQFFCDSNL